VWEEGEEEVDARKEGEAVERTEDCLSVARLVLERELGGLTLERGE